MKYKKGDKLFIEVTYLGSLDNAFGNCDYKLHEVNATMFSSKYVKENIGEQFNGINLIVHDSVFHDKLSGNEELLTSIKNMIDKAG
jgi:hypothetical protein